MKTLWLPVTIGLLAGGSTGCLGLKPKPDPTRYFVLTPRLAAETPAPSRLTLGVRRVSVPDYLDKPWIARRHGNEIHYAQDDEWAEKLDRGIQRVLAASLSAGLGTDQVSVDHWPLGSVQYDVSVVIDRFEVDQTGQVSLVARWQIEERGEPPRRRSGAAEWTRQAAEAALDSAATAALLSDVLGDFSHELTQVIRELAGRPIPVKAAPADGG